MFSLVKSLVELGSRSFFQGFLGEAAIQNLDGVEFFSFLYRFLLPFQEGLESKGVKEVRRGIVTPS